MRVNSQGMFKFSSFIPGFFLLLQFLAAATNKLGLRSHARIVYDWSGNEIKDFDQSKYITIILYLLLHYLCR